MQSELVVFSLTIKLIEIPYMILELWIRFVGRFCRIPELLTLVDILSIIRMHYAWLYFGCIRFAYICQMVYWVYLYRVMGYFERNSQHSALHLHSEQYCTAMIFALSRPLPMDEADYGCQMFHIIWVISYYV